MDEKLKKEIIETVKSLSYQLRYNPKRDYEDEAIAESALNSGKKLLEKLMEKDHEKS